MFGDIVAPCVIWVVPIAGIDFTKDRVKRLLHAATLMSDQTSESRVWTLLRRFNVPTTEVELSDSDESL